MGEVEERDERREVFERVRTSAGELAPEAAVALLLTIDGEKRKSLNGL